MPVSVSFVDPDVLNELGRFTVDFNTLEGTLRDEVRLLAGLDHGLGDIFTAKLAFAQLTDLTAALIHHRSKRGNDGFLDLKNRLDKLRQERNLLIHSEWRTDIESGEHTSFRVIVRAKTGPEGTFQPRTVSEIRALSVQAQELASAIHDFVLRMDLSGRTPEASDGSR